MQTKFWSGKAKEEATRKT